MQPQPRTWTARAGHTLGIAILASLLAGSVILARRNLASGHGDHRGAVRIAAVTFFINFLVWVLTANHAPSFQQEWELLFPVLAMQVFFSMLLWALYVALEPHVRKRWPDSLIGWSRLLSGRPRDPRVGREVLIGSVSACLFTLGLAVAKQVPAWLGMPPLPPDETWMPGLLSPFHSVIGLIELLSSAIVNGMAFLLLLSVLRRLVRRDFLALAVFVGLFSLIAGGQMLVWWIGIPMGALLATTWVMILRRAGLLALIAMLEAQNCIEASSTTTDWSRWYAAAGFVGPAVVVLLALYGFRVATAGRPLFKFRLLAD